MNMLPLKAASSAERVKVMAIASECRCGDVLVAEGVTDAEDSPSWNLRPAINEVSTSSAHNECGDPAPPHDGYLVHNSGMPGPLTAGKYPQWAFAEMIRR